MKEKALSRLAAPKARPGRYRPDEKLLAFLEALRLCRTRRVAGEAVPAADLAMRHNPAHGIMRLMAISA
jgi:hypothetical protein